MAAQLLWIFASAVLLLLGSAHLYLTFFSNKFSIRDKTVEDGMRKTYPVLTSKTTVWKAWVGFNASHSLAGIYIGAVNIILAVHYYAILSNSWLIKGLTFSAVSLLFFLGVKYWFRTPLVGITLSLVAYLIAAGLM